jgi:CheY-like chemotaxis protein/anti-sigma regulatory factor (Ser/Thr protein kinase)
MTHVLVVEDSRTQALEIQFLLEDEGFTAAVAWNGREALKALARAGEAPVPDVVLTDLEMPEMNGLELVEAVRQKHPGLPVVLMTALGSEEIAVQALAKGAASYVPKRNLTQDIASTLHDVVSVAQAGRDQKLLMSCLAQTDLHFVLDSDPALVSPLIGHLEQQASGLLPGDRTERMRIGVALHEAVLNAIYHGNLEVSSDLRQEDERAFHALATARRQAPPYSGRRVHVHACLARNKAVYVVRDEGPGFDPSAMPDPSDPANLERVGGRGLMLIRTFMDEVAHNASGNQITMLKRYQ